ncbi:MAG: 2,3-bisphosphoglycerate-independent phosphoglycerate mutase [Patescibacteria group bacterium]|nr:MAG: 2,3-bisphosphoglycerate-independent phosphoglycerate mutase [Patescibacteria group bacterium]
MPTPKPVVLLILDGWGVAPPDQGNALAIAKTPNIRALASKYPAMTLQSSGEEVGLMWGEMGNSEVGHLTIGAGKVYYQSLPRINRAVQGGEFATNMAFVKAVEHVKKNGTKLHLLGLASIGNVHASLEHLLALLDFAKANDVKETYVHAVLDGRDTTFNAGIDFITTVTERMKKNGVGKIATLSGRFYAMDRDNRWDRIEKAYRAMVEGKADATSDDPLAAIRASYEAKVYDEEFVPTVITENGAPVATIGAGDAVIVFNYRPDRSREITRALALPDFDKFARPQVSDLLVITMTEYEKGFPVEVAFPPEPISTCLAKVISDAGMKQLHIAETEKYAHVTFFLNGMKEDPFRGEDRVIIPSPQVSSYDQQPEMSAPLITERIVKEINAGKYDLIAANYANGDMVGHTGNLDATVKAAEVVDASIGKIVEAALEKGGVVLITADHGNAEEVVNLQTGSIDKEHSTYPVPFLIIGQQFEGMAGEAQEMVGGDLSLSPPVGMLSDVTPTILRIMGIPQPSDMTGRPLI